MDYTNRNFVSPDEILDAFAGMKGKKFISFGYISSANLDKLPKLPPDDKKKKHPDFTVLRDYINNNSEQNYDIAGIVKFTVYNQQYYNVKEMDAAYNNYKLDANIIRGNHQPTELPLIGDKMNNTRQNVNYGYGLKIGNNGEPVMPLNIYHSTKRDPETNQKIGHYKRSEYYLIDSKGMIIGEAIKPELMNQIFAQYKKPKPPSKFSPKIQTLLDNIGGSDSGFTALKNANASEEEMTRYLQNINNLQMNYRDFKYSSIAFFVGTGVDGKFFYVNNKFSQQVDGIHLNEQVFVELAKKRYDKAVEELLKLEQESL